MTAAVAERPTDPEAQAMLGAARFTAGDPLGAASAFRRVVILQPDNAQAWARLGESLVRAAKGTVGGDAEAAFLEAIRLDPQQGGARYYLGELALQRGDLVFFPGHVGIMMDADTLVHANAHWMQVVAEPLADVIARFPETTLQPVLARKRIA